MGKLGLDEAKRWIVEPGPLKWLIDLMMDAGGAVEEVGMTSGWRPLTWGEIRDWMEVTQTRLEPGTVRKLRMLSKVYAAAQATSGETNAPAPYEPPKKKGGAA